MEKWKIWIENQEVECKKLQLYRDELKKRIEDLHIIMKNNKEHIETKIRQKESIIDNSKLYSMILFLMEKADDFDVEFERNSLEERIEFLKRKRGRMIWYNIKIICK